MPPDPWRYRRRFMTLTWVFSAATIWLVIFRETDPAVAQTAITMAFGVLGSSLGTYVFGAAWEKKPPKG